MKKSLICGIASLALAAAPALSTFALGTGTQTHDVTVGEVDETVYSVEIDWGNNMVFNWKYSYDTNSFGFKPNLGCEGYVMSGADIHLTQAQEDGRLYSDNTCTTLQTGELENGTSYYQKTAIGGHIHVEDSSINGRVKVHASFTPDENYDWVVGKFAGTYEHNLTTGEIAYSDDFEDGYLVPQLGSIGYAIYHSWLHLETDNNLVSSESITSNDTIGTGTLTIEPDLN